MIYKAFLNRQEITGFPVKGKETSEIWGGNVLLWKKETKPKGIFKFEYYQTVEFGVQGTELNVDWGDGTSEYLGDKHREANLYSEDGNGYLKHTAESRRYIATITGNIVNMKFGTMPGIKHYADGILRVLSPLPATCNKFYSSICNFLFYKCLNLQSVPENLFELVPDIESMAFTFCDTNLYSYPDTMFDYLPNLKKVDSVFGGSTIENVSGKMFSKCTKLKEASSLFSDCEKLTNVEQGFLSTQKLNYFIDNFSRCKNLVKVGSDFLQNVDIKNAERGFETEFFNCTNLREAPNYYERYPNLESRKAQDCYYNCKRLSFYSSLPNDWK